MKILGISGSLRAASNNTGLLRAASELAPAGVEILIHDIGDVPLYNGDEDGGEGNRPAGVIRLRQAIADADALLLAVPEYNYSVTGVQKNVLDWASRSTPTTPLNGKPLAMMGAGGMSGTMRAQFHLRQMLVHSNLLVMNKPELYIARAWEKFDKQGNLTDEATRDMVKALVEGLAAWVSRLRGA
ncbi:NAD(P)H-dependent oxidoreductase [Oscillochloris sp. ZM17-4]|uniref:NADPH-dependent FMN reductase n=1 Tax=Oscillochloris sp. ZM17-4 TaxID=2866714 RepID=UPI001C736E69|nr:NAD(P)H-dependent oxidoreductase [Oscillochloris sp. ZM17-4]MBX0329341.1 NAD(P)H-dependent oxidoreductase [Oscillochloris sp. ZM17-4]